MELSEGLHHEQYGACSQPIIWVHGSCSNCMFSKIISVVVQKRLNLRQIFNTYSCYFASLSCFENLPFTAFLFQFVIPKTA